MSDQPPNRSESGASGVREFAARTKLLLNESERQYMYAILREYRTYKQLDALVLCLRSVLDTPVKMDLLKDIRRFVEHSQLSKYDELVPYHKMAHPWAKNSSPDLNSRRRRGSGFKNVSQSTDPQSPKTSAKGTDVLPRKGMDSRSSFFPKASSRKIVRVYRDPKRPLDFEISGGSEEGRGIFVSRVKSHSPPDRAGLRAGDHILEANGVTFDAISYNSAVDVLTNAPKLTMLVRTAGKHGVRRSDSEKILWYDVEEKRLVADAFIEHDFLKLFRANSRVYRKVSIHVQQGRRYLGFNIRGGSEYDLGIYVSRVDAGGLGERKGVRVGDRLMVVNGVSFNNISHSDAVRLLRAQRRLFLILLFVGFYPVCKEVLDGFSELDAVSMRLKDGKALLEPRPRKKPGSRFMEDTRLDHIWKSLSDGELWAEEEEDDEISIGSLPLHRWKREKEEDAVPVYGVVSSSNHLRPQAAASGRRSVNVFMVSREMASITPVFRDGQRRRGLDGYLSEDPDLDRVFLQEGKHSKIPRTMKKTRSLRDLSRNERKRSDVEQIFSSDEELDDDQHVALASLEIAAHRLDLLNEDEIQAVVRRTKQYFIDGDLESYIEPLMAILDTKERQKLLTHIRPLIRRPHLSTFDQWTKLVARPRGNKDGSRDMDPHRHLTPERDSPRSKASQRSEVDHHDNHKRQVTVPSLSSSFGHHGFEMPLPESRYKSEQNDRKNSSSPEAGRRSSKDPKWRSRVERSSTAPNVPSLSPSNPPLLRRSRRPAGNRVAEALSSPETAEGLQPPNYFRDNEVVHHSSGLPSDVDRQEWIHSISSRRQPMIDNPWHLGKEDRRGGEGRSRGIDERDSGREDLRGRQSTVDLHDNREKDLGRRHLPNRSKVNSPSDDSEGFSSSRSKTHLHSEGHNEDLSVAQLIVNLHAEDHEDFSGPRSKVDLHGEDYGGLGRLISNSKDREDVTRSQSVQRKAIQELESSGDKENKWNADGGEQRNTLNKEIEHYRRNGSVSVGLPTQRGHRGVAGHEVRSKMNHTGNWSKAEVNEKPGSMQTRDNGGVEGLSGASIWNWNEENLSVDSAHENDNAAYRTDSIPSATSALQLLDRVLRSEDASISDIRSSRKRQPLTLPMSNPSKSPDSDVASTDSNLTSRRGSYDVTVPSLRNSLSQINLKHVRSLSKSSSSRFVDSGVASDFRSSTPVLAGFSLHRDIQSPAFHDDNSAVSLTSIRHFGDEFPDHRSASLLDGNRSKPDLRDTRELESRSNQRLSNQGQGPSQGQQTVLSNSGMPLTFNMQKWGDKERRTSSIKRVEPLTVFLEKSHENLGLSISGGSDSPSQPNIMIDDVIPGGAADLEGTLKPGMQILSIDDVSLKQVTHQEAINIIRIAFKDRSMPVMKLRALP